MATELNFYRMMLLRSRSWINASCCLLLFLVLLF